MIYMALIPTIGLTIYCMSDPDLANILGLAWDCGAVTTGPVTVPLVLALGIGIAASGGKGESSLSGFGIVTLASLFPIIAVLCLAVYVSTVTTPEAIIAAAKASTAAAALPAWHEVTPWAEIKGGAQAIIPLVVFLFLLDRRRLHCNRSQYICQRVRCSVRVFLRIVKAVKIRPPQQQMWTVAARLQQAQNQ